jgi:predicted ATPase
MFSAFKDEVLLEIIYICFYDSLNGKLEFNLNLDVNNPRKWIDIYSNILFSAFKNTHKELEISNDLEKLELLKKKFREFNEVINRNYFEKDFSNFIIYSLEESRLRKFEDTNQIYPLGIKGEGLFQYIKELILNEKNHTVIDEIKENLALLDWYEDFKIPENLMSNEFSLKIKDKYLNENLQFFDQRSTNEGFLYLLFYITLFISKDTPSFFAIDNIDASFNPKLCRQLTRNLALLAKKHNKQVIVTTHNPAILDGLNLQDDAQRLFVVRRNDDGHTKINRIEHKSERKMKLSEIWTNGFIGGLPENF